MIPLENFVVAPTLTIYCVLLRQEVIRSPVSWSPERRRRTCTAFLVGEAIGFLMALLVARQSEICWPYLGSNVAAVKTIDFYLTAIILGGCLSVLVTWSVLDLREFRTASAPKRIAAVVGLIVAGSVCAWLYAKMR
jgi:hypothetical protein